MRIITVQDIAQLIKKHGFNDFILDLVNYLKSDFSRWNEFDKSPRHAIHVQGGVIELMPIADQTRYTFKYVNGHPKNPLSGKQTIVATGQISNSTDGYPTTFSEMSIMTGFRTAATSIIATDLLARQNSSTLAMIGTGAQSEFQTLAHRLVRDIKTVKYYDIDPQAMIKYYDNLKDSGLELIACDNAESAIENADIITVCTACKAHVDVILDKWIKPGVHINALGGDCPGKTELEAAILFRSKIVVEFLEQSLIEGEIQRLTREEANTMVHGELWELITNKKVSRITDSEITVFDSVGFALEDYSALRLVEDLTNKYNIGADIDIVPLIDNPKNLISAIY